MNFSLTSRILSVFCLRQDVLQQWRQERRVFYVCLVFKNKQKYVCVVILTVDNFPVINTIRLLGLLFTLGTAIRYLCSQSVNEGCLPKQSVELLVRVPSELPPLLKAIGEIVSLALKRV